MADAKVCRGQRRVSRNRPCENLPACGPYRGRSRSHKRSRLAAGVESQSAEVISCNADGFVNLEVDVSVKVESHGNCINIKPPRNLKLGKRQNPGNLKRPGNFKSGNPANPKNPECLDSANSKGPQNLAFENPKIPENLASVSSKDSECLRHARDMRRRNRESLKYRNHNHQIKAEPGSRIKSEGSLCVTACEPFISEVNFKLEDDSLNAGRSIVRNPAFKGAADRNKKQSREKLSGCIDDCEAENKCTDELSLVLDLNERSLAKKRKITRFVPKDGKSVVQSSMPCSVIGSKKIEDAVVKLDTYLDTDIIDRYMEHIWKKLPKYKQESCTYLDCLWFSMYLGEALSSNILKWTRAKHIFSKQYVFIPIVHWGHWNLLILCHFGEDLSSKARTPCILLLDSLKETEPNRLEPLIRKFLIDVDKEDGKWDGDKNIAKIPLLVPEVPQQTNGNDCGVFLLHFVDKFLKQAPKNFSISEGCYPYFLTKNWFKSHEIGKRRKQIYDVISKDRGCVSQMTKRRISTRSKKFHGFLNSDQASKWIDLSTAA